MRFLLKLCDRGQFEKIIQYFPVRGHSFLPCDRDFGSIKRLLRRTDRIYTPQEYADLIVKASKVGRFSIHQVRTDEIISFKDWWPRSYKKTPTPMKLLEGVFPKIKEYLLRYQPTKSLSTVWIPMEK